MSPRFLRTARKQAKPTLSENGLLYSCERWFLGRCFARRVFRTVNLGCARGLADAAAGLKKRSFSRTSIFIKALAETNLRHEPPDHRAPDEAPEAQDEGGTYPTGRARLVSRHGGVSVFFEQGRRNQPDGYPDPQWHED